MRNSFILCEPPLILALNPKPQPHEFISYIILKIINFYNFFLMIYKQYQWISRGWGFTIKVYFYFIQYNQYFRENRCFLLKLKVSNSVLINELNVEILSIHEEKNPQNLLSYCQRFNHSSIFKLQSPPEIQLLIKSSLDSNQSTLINYYTLKMNIIMCKLNEFQGIEMQHQGDHQQLFTAQNNKKTFSPIYIRD
ncbi:hypothetical protein pb186bvf_008985 [Paramecium bursaria]